MTKTNVRHIIRAIVIGAGLVVLLCSWAQAENSASSKLHTLLEQTNSLSARFQQQISYDKNKSVAERFRGDFLFLKPNYLRWVVEPPAAQEIVSNCTKIWIHDVELEQVIVQDV